LPFSAAIALCPLEAPGRSSCREKNTPTPESIDKSTEQQKLVSGPGALSQQYCEKGFGQLHYKAVSPNILYFDY
jgi:hypothetical protein